MRTAFTLATLVLLLMVVFPYSKDIQTISPEAVEPGEAPALEDTVGSQVYRESVGDAVYP
ncbi:hypothetical protein [Paenibacillus gansuensis]|uniref:Uncharacterized protein n=1 Tax=Paenibacillus gansuensis TaxID=306542 RepID=A0ABW5PGX4_9BACL